MPSTRMLIDSRDRAKPASSITKPTCMQKTRNAASSTHTVLSALISGDGPAACGLRVQRRRQIDAHRREQQRQADRLAARERQHLRAHLGIGHAGFQPSPHRSSHSSSPRPHKAASRFPCDRARRAEPQRGAARNRIERREPDAKCAGRGFHRPAGRGVGSPTARTRRRQRARQHGRREAPDPRSSASLPESELPWSDFSPTFPPGRSDENGAVNGEIASTTISPAKNLEIKSRRTRRTERRPVMR